jgi:hypothetical protein
MRLTARDLRLTTLRLGPRPLQSRWPQGKLVSEAFCRKPQERSITK